jgi:hypothetical protein
MGKLLSGTPLWRRRKLGFAADFVADTLLRMGGALKKIDRLAEAAAPGRVLVCGVRVPKRSADIDRTMQCFASKRHEVRHSVVDMGHYGKFENINRAIEAAGGLDGFDWLMISDDDVALVPDFVDRAIGLCAATDTKVAQPSHRFHSYVSHDHTQRAFNSLVREVRFVEIGPVTILHRDTFAKLLPFPTLRWGWGLDLWWAQVAQENGWRMAMLDGLPLEHLRPVGNIYSTGEAWAESEQFLTSNGVHTTWHDVLNPGKVILPVRA